MGTTGENFSIFGSFSKIIFVNLIVYLQYIVTFIVIHLIEDFPLCFLCFTLCLSFLSFSRNVIFLY